jgi:hypothetical protein
MVAGAIRNPNSRRDDNRGLIVSAIFNAAGAMLRTTSEPNACITKNVAKHRQSSRK